MDRRFISVLIVQIQGVFVSPIQVLEEDPDNVDALLSRSQCYMDNGQLDLCLKDANAAFNRYKKVNVSLLSFCHLVYYI